MPLTYISIGVGLTGIWCWCCDFFVVGVDKGRNGGDFFRTVVSPQAQITNAGINVGTYALA